MNELREELTADKGKADGRLFSRRVLRLFALFALVATFAIYIGDLLFGQNSYSTILYLEDQKEYFELKKIGGDK